MNGICFSRYRLVFFSHTIDEAHKDDPEALEEFRVVDLAVRDARISLAPSLTRYDQFSAKGSELG